MRKLRSEFGGILKWAIEGEVLRQRLGLRPPASVMKATDAYFRAEDTIGRWIDERCIKGSDERALPGELYRDYLSWAATVGEFYKPSLKDFGEELNEQPGIERGRVELARGADGKRRESPQGVIGLSLRFAVPELPFDAGRRLAERGDQGTTLARASYAPPIAPDDPGDDWSR